MLNSIAAGEWESSDFLLPAMCDGGLVCSCSIVGGLLSWIGLSRLKMKRNVIVSILVGLTLVGLILGLTRSSRPDPQDLSAWMRLAEHRDWSALAAQGDPEAEFFLGLTLIRTNLIQMIGRVPRLSAIPVIGKRFFEETHYGLDNQIAPEQLAEAHRWIKRSAEQGYAPALEAEKLFIGRLAVTNTPDGADLTIPVRQP